MAPLLPTNLLVDSLIASNASIVSSVEARPSRKTSLVNLSKAAKYSLNQADSDTELANILFRKELDRRFAGQGMSAVAFHPGNVRMNFIFDTTSMTRFVYQTPLETCSPISLFCHPHVLCCGVVVVDGDEPGTAPLRNGLRPWRLKKHERPRLDACLGRVEVRQDRIGPAAHSTLFHITSPPFQRLRSRSC
jgi:hypothetical protein